jgi:hypothetical protein
MEFLGNAEVKIPEILRYFSVAIDEDFLRFPLEFWSY